MIESLLPPAVVAVEAFHDVPGEPPFPGEEALVATAVASRRREFVTARRCAREALQRLGYPPAPILTGPGRAPRWPDGVAGTITHCAGYRAAAVAHHAEVAVLGIDAEPHEALPAGVLAEVTGDVEAAMVGGLGRAHPGVHWDRLLFSAKESIYKAWFPLTRRWLGFTDAHLTIDPENAAFTARIAVDGTRLDGGPPLTTVHGRYLVEAGLILTAVHPGPR